MRKLKHETVVTNSENGNITTSKTFSVKADNDSFFMTFIESMDGLFNIKNATDFRVLAYLNTMAEFNTGKVTISTDDRVIMRDSLDIDNQVLSNSLKRLNDAGMIRGKRGMYEINPLIFWKGTTDERRKILKGGGYLEVKIKFYGNKGVEDEKTDKKQVHSTN